MIFEILTLILVLGAATAATVETIHVGSIFNDFRAKAEIRGNLFVFFFLCQFCLSHWVAASFCLMAWWVVSNLSFLAFILIVMCVRFLANRILHTFIPIVMCVRFLATRLLEALPENFTS